MATADVIVVGGGVIGGSIAYHLLARDPRLKVILLEKEAEVGTGATSKATGGVRHQFSTETNIRLTQLSYPYFADAERVLGRSVDFIPHGYLFVTTEPGTFEQLKKNVALQRRRGVRSRLIDPREMKAMLSQLVVDDLLGGTFCPDDGSADPYGLLQGFLALARERGLRVLTSEPVVSVSREGERVVGVETPRDRYRAPVVVNAAGPYADRVGALVGVAIPSKPYRRQVLVTDPLPDFPEVFPLIVDLDTGWYVHRQGKSAVLMGGTDKDEHPGYDTTVDWEAFDLVFKAAGKRVPPLADAKVMRAYAGVRDLTPDYHGILCAARDPQGFYIACGFSGHGFMHSPAIGLLMAELILDGRATSMDIGGLSLERFKAGTVSTEANMF
ncbi:MAG: FAD-binding oxidoreductase [Candidatus Rokubacteria bacterium]|nr:FAD-binding oxidoreductase [Candidatus Rokubacteria bacterium]MBI2552900.1 FAD-binding oxidoreductase [Candidatus Rokubacteria bacterium]